MTLHILVHENVFKEIGTTVYNYSFATENPIISRCKTCRDKFHCSVMATVVEVEENAGNDRVHVTEDNVIDVCDVCVASEPPKHRDMRIMIKEGKFKNLFKKIHFLY